MNCQISWEEQGVSVVFEGKVSIEDIDNAGEYLSNDPRFIDCKYQLFNFDLADLSAISLEQIRNTAQMDVEISSNFPSPSLAVVSRHAIADALIFHYRQITEGAQIKWDIQIFETEDEALAWCKSLTL